ncbi:MAG: CHRD domain-containing protein [Nitrospirae bacterium]|nr:CHRD domain-containing protein [Nitrospirota bacterium]
MNDHGIRGLTSLPGVLIALILAACGGGGGGSNTVTSDSGGSPVSETASTFAAHDRLTENLLQQFVTDSQSKGELAARETLVSNLRREPLVKSAAILSDGLTVEVHFTTGSRVYLFAYNRSQTQTQAGRSADAPDYGRQSAEGKPKALIISPYWFNEGGGYSQTKDAVKTAGYDLVVQENMAFGRGEVDLADYSNWSSYSLVIVSSHGSGSLLDTGVPIADLREFNEVMHDPYKVAGRAPDDKGYTYGLKPEYFSKVAAKMQNTLVIFDACKNGTEDWAGALQQAGAGAFVGFMEEIGWDEGNDAINRLIPLLASCKSLGEAIDSLRSQGVFMYAGPAAGLSWKMCEGCLNISGVWSFIDNGRVTCSGGGETDTAPISGSGAVNIAQNGCNVSWSVSLDGVNYSRAGSVSGNAIQVSGPFVVPLEGGVNITQNTYSASGTISADTRKINLNGTGSATGSYEGVGFTCTGTDKVTLTRLSVAAYSSLGLRRQQPKLLLNSSLIILTVSNMGDRFE